MNKKCEVLQENHNDCAAACLLSIIKYYNGYISLEDVRILINTSKNGTNAYDLLEGAKRIGFDAAGNKCDFDSLINMERPLPLIAHIKKGNYYHFVVIYKIDKIKKQLLIMDPSIGFKKISFDYFKKVYLNVVLLFNKVKELPKNIHNRKLLNDFITILLKNKKLLIITIILSFLIFILSIIQINLYRNIFDSDLIIKNIYKTAILFLLILITKNIIELVRNHLIIKIKYITDRNMNTKTIEKIFLLSYDYLKNKTTGEIISRINDIDLLKDVFLDLILNAFVNIILLLIFLFLIYKISFIMMLITIIYIVIYLLLTLLYKHKYEIKTRELQDDKGKYTNDLVETIDSLETINNLGINNTFSNKIKNSYKEYINRMKHFNKITTTEHFFKNVMSDMIVLIEIIVSIYLISIKKISVSDAIIVYMIFTYISSILQSLLNRMPDISYALNNVETTSILLSRDIETKEDGFTKGDINICSMSYSTGIRQLINRASLLIPIKSKLCLTGNSGVGKSTIIKILLKYKNNYDGEVTINGINLRDISIDSIKKNFVYIGQNEKLFSGSLLYNISLNRNIDDEEIEKICKICHIDEIIKKKTLTKDFYIEPDGFNLSGGERQRIILARGLLKKCEYIFIDEALSEVDLEMESNIVKNILSTFKDKTIIYVSHKKEVSNLFESVYNLERRTYE